MRMWAINIKWMSNECFDSLSFCDLELALLSLIFRDTSDFQIVSLCGFIILRFFLWFQHVYKMSFILHHKIETETK